MASGTTRSVVTRPPTYQAIIGALQSFWEKQGCVVMQPYHTEVGAGTFNPATSCAASTPRPWRAAYVEPSIAARRRPLRREPLPPAATISSTRWCIKPSPPDIQDLYLQSLRGPGHRPAAPRRALRRGQLGGAHPGRLGPGLGGLGGRHGDHPVHLLPAARRHRPATRSRSSSPTAWSASPCTCRASTASTTSSGALDGRRRRAGGHLRRRLPRERARVQPLQLRGRRRRHAVPPLPRVRGRGAALPRGRPAAPGLRLRAQVQPHLQPARRARRHQRDRPHAPTSRSVRDLARKVAGLYLEVTADGNDAAGADRNDVNRTDAKRGNPSQAAEKAGGPRDGRLAVRDRRRGAALSHMSLAARPAARRRHGRGARPGLRGPGRRAPDRPRRGRRSGRLRRDAPQGDGGPAARRRLGQGRAARSRPPRRCATAGRAPMWPSGPTARPPRRARASLVARGSRRPPCSARPSTAPSSWSL